MTTIKDVARACGVSTATVSYVINGKHVLLPETREKVLVAMRELRYHPSAVARGLSHKRMNTIGILFGTVNTGIVVNHPYSSSILQGILTAASASGYNATFYTDPWRTADRSAASYRDRRTDGIVVVAPPTDSDVIQGLTRYDLSIVAVSYPGEAAGIASVDTDNVLGARLAIQHLLDLGHRRIAHLTGPLNMLSASLRAETYRSMMDGEYPGIPDVYYGQPNAFDEAAAYMQTRHLLTMPNPPTAIFASNDQNAFGAMKAARDLGISVPVRLSIVGYDDTPEGATTRPALTSVRQPLTLIGETAGRLLISQLAGEAIDTKMCLLPPQLIVRGSTAAPVT